MRRWFGSGFCGLALAVSAGAQTHIVKKPETVVRAVGVYEWTGELGKAKASRFVPVTVFIDNQLEDAGFYLARPVPFALETGTLFELDKAGVPDGTLELAYQRHLVTGGDDAQVDGGWLGYGAYKAQPVVKASTKKSGPISKIEVSGGKAEKTASDPDRPTMKRKTDSGDGGTDTSKTASTPADDPDRPTMKRKSDADQTPAATTDSNSKDSTDAKTSTGSGASSQENDPERPTLRKRSEAQRQGARKEHDTSSVTGVGSLNDDPDRPNLHRGKPVSRMDEDELPPLRGTPPDMEQMVAVSDAKNRDTHDFSRPWTEDAERVAILGKMQTIARARLAAYGGPASNGASGNAAGIGTTGRSKTVAPAASATSGGRSGTRRAVSRKPIPDTQIQVSQEVLKGFTLSYGGAATYFYSASTSGADGVVRYVSVVAQQEPLGELKVALASVTDVKHLDRTPWMRLVDAVDVEASNRASLLMELRGQSTRQFAIYRVIGAQAEQRFVSGGTE